MLMLMLWLFLKIITDGVLEDRGGQVKGKNMGWHFQNDYDVWVYTCETFQVLNKILAIFITQRNKMLFGQLALAVLTRFLSETPSLSFHQRTPGLPPAGMRAHRSGSVWIGQLFWSLDGVTLRAVMLEMSRMRAVERRCWTAQVSGPLPTMHRGRRKTIRGPDLESQRVCNFQKELSTLESD